MKAWKIIYSIICLPIIGFMIYQVYTIGKWTNDIGGTLGYVVAALFVVLVIVTFASLKAEQKTIMNIIIGGIGIAAAIFAFICSQDNFEDMVIYGIWGLICALFPLLSGIIALTKGSKK